MDSSISTGQRYRVFLNEKSILISEDINIADYQATDRIVNYEGMTNMKLEYDRFKLDEHCNQLVFHSKDVFNEAWNSFRSLFREIKAAGGLARNQEGNLLFIFRLGVWDLPKGKLKKNEMPEEGALREVSEETGLSGLRIIKPLPQTYHIYANKKGDAILKETLWFEMIYEGNEVPVPQTEEDITAVQWFRPDQLDIILKNTYPALKPMIQSSCR
jgi:ADP-ribose pyrophosphatase YjhB (NUDIX family)